MLSDKPVLRPSVFWNMPLVYEEPDEAVVMASRRASIELAAWVLAHGYTGRVTIEVQTDKPYACTHEECKVGG